MAGIRGRVAIAVLSRSTPTSAWDTVLTATKVAFGTLYVGSVCVVFRTRRRYDHVIARPNSSIATNILPILATFTILVLPLEGHIDLERRHNFVSGPKELRLFVARATFPRVFACSIVYSPACDSPWGSPGRPSCLGAAHAPRDFRIPLSALLSSSRLRDDSLRRDGKARRSSVTGGITSHEI